MPEPTRILICDDTTTLLDFLELVFEKQGFEVIKAGYGEAALELAEDQHPDIALVDVMMPGIDGLEVCRRLRANPETAKLPILLYSAIVGEEVRRDALAAGADEFIGKTLHHAELVSKVRDWLATSSLPGGIGKPAAVAGLKDLLELLDTDIVWALSVRGEQLESLALVCRLGEQEARRFLDTAGRGPFRMSMDMPLTRVLEGDRRVCDWTTHRLGKEPGGAGLARALTHIGAYGAQICPLSGQDDARGLLFFSSPASLLDDTERTQRAAIGLRYATNLLKLWMMD